MKSSSLSVSRLSTNGLTGSLLRRGVLRQLGQLKPGQLLVVEDGERLMFGTPGSAMLGEIHVLDSALWGMVASNGSIGAGEAFIHGYWSSPDLTAVVRVFVSNLEVLDAMEGGLARISRPLVQGLHWLNRNTRKGSQKNIAAHYDLGNDLFEQFLDPTMMYSAAQFLTPEDTLEQAQLNKLERICQKLALKPSDHLLEIGTGWGSMALYAAQNYGCRVTTTTLSKEQYAFTAQRIEHIEVADEHSHHGGQVRRAPIAVDKRFACTDRAVTGDHAPGGGVEYVDLAHQGTAGCAEQHPLAILDHHELPMFEPGHLPQHPTTQQRTGQAIGAEPTDRQTRGFHGGVPWEAR